MSKDTLKYKTEEILERAHLELKELASKNGVDCIYSLHTVYHRDFDIVDSAHLDYIGTKCPVLKELMCSLRDSHNDMCENLDAMAKEYGLNKDDQPVKLYFMDDIH